MPYERSTPSGSGKNGIARPLTVDANYRAVSVALSLFDRIPMHLKLAEGKNRDIGNGSRNDCLFSCIRVRRCRIKQNDHWHRWPDVPQVQDRFDQVHLFACREKNDDIECFVANGSQRFVAIADPF